MENTLTRFVRFFAIFLDLATTGFVKIIGIISLLFWRLGRGKISLLSLFAKEG
jgi:hypothetical protein